MRSLNLARNFSGTSRSTDICGVVFRLTDYDDAIDLFKKWLCDGKSRQVCIANVHCLVISLTDKKFREILNNADLVTMDGQPLRWYAKIVHSAKILNRVTGPELMLKCLEHGLRFGWRHFFLGSTDEVLVKLQKNLSKKFDEVSIVGAYSPPFRVLTNEEDKALVAMINKAKPDFLWVGLGAPKQEKWIFDHLSRVHVPLQIGVGAAFDFHSGNIKRAPRFLQEIGLEWLFRIYCDPSLLKRYLETNPIFISILIRDFIKLRLLNRRQNSNKYEI